MLCNTTYNDKKTIREINELVGEAYSFIKSIKLKGTGSHRMIISEVCPPFTNILSKNADIKYGAIELRPKGIIFHVNKGLENYSWAIPYYKLVIFKSDTLSIHADGKFIKVLNDKFVQKNLAFITKINTLKEKYLKNYNEAGTN